MNDLIDDALKWLWILEPDHSVRHPESLEEWVTHQNDDKGRLVAFTDLEHCRISTVFLGIDHGYYIDRPILFETAIFRPTLVEIACRYGTWAEAAAGHVQVVTDLQRPY